MAILGRVGNTNVDVDVDFDFLMLMTGVEAMLLSEIPPFSTLFIALEGMSWKR